MDHIPPYKEEYWNSALKTLKREERKAALRRLFPFLIVFLVLGLGAVTWLSLESAPEGRSLTAINSDSGILIYKAHRSIEYLEESKGAIEDDLLSADLKNSSSLHPSGAGSLLADNSIKPKNATVKVTESQVQSTERVSSPSNPIALPSQSLLTSEAENLLEKDSPLEMEPDRTSGSSTIGSMSNDRSVLGNRGSANYVTASSKTDLEFIPILGLPQMPAKSGIPLGRSGSTKFKSAYISERVNHFYLDLSNSVLTGFGTNKNDLRFNPQLGLGYEWLIGREMAIAAGVRYFQVSGTNYGISIDQTELGFGAVTTRTNIEANTLKYLSLPLEWNYHLDRRHAVGIQGTIDYLLDAESTVSVDRNEVMLSNSSEGGYYQGLKSLTFAVGAQYSFRLNNRWMAELVYLQGLTEVQRSEYYEATGNDRNSRLIVGLNYQIKP